MNSRWSRERDSKPHGRGEAGRGRGEKGQCVERMVPGREAADGQNTLGEATDLWEPGGGTAVAGGTSGVKGRGPGYLRPYLAETAHCKRLEMLAKI